LKRAHRIDMWDDGESIVEHLVGSNRGIPFLLRRFLAGTHTFTKYGEGKVHIIGRARFKQSQ
jgi:hypothetical protein